MSAAHTTVSCSQCGSSFGYGTAGFSHCTGHALATRFRAMVDDLRPVWREREERRRAAAQADREARALLRPAVPRAPLTFDDYLARLQRYDSTAYLSDDREVARAGMEERDNLRRMARQFDADLKAWRQVEAARGLRQPEGAWS